MILPRIVGDDVHSEILPSIESPMEAAETPFPFKFKAPSGRVHRIQVLSSSGVGELVSQVTAKLGSEAEAVGGEATIEDGKLGRAGYALSYMDNEGDTVSITTDQDLIDAISLAQKGKRDKVDLFVHDPTQPPISPLLILTPTLETTHTSGVSTKRGIAEGSRRGGARRGRRCTRGQDRPDQASSGCTTRQAPGPGTAHCRYTKRPTSAWRDRHTRRSHCWCLCNQPSHIEVDQRVWKSRANPLLYLVMIPTQLNF